MPLFIKMTKAQVKAILRKLKEQPTFTDITIAMCPSNCHPAYDYWDISMQWSYHSDMDKPVSTFDTRVAQYEHYNCNKELGKRVHYYIVKEG
jgi:hypothetical protein